MSSETTRGHPVLALPAAELAALSELEALLQANSMLKEGQSIPLSQDEIEKPVLPIGASIEDNAVVALSLRYCALRIVPESLGQFARLQRLDVTGNQLTALPRAARSDW